jgi:hypothetical protein
MPEPAVTQDRWLLHQLPETFQVTFEVGGTVSAAHIRRTGLHLASLAGTVPGATVDPQRPGDVTDPDSGGTTADPDVHCVPATPDVLNNQNLFSRTDMVLRAGEVGPGLATGPILPLDNYPGDATALQILGHSLLEAIAEPVRLGGGSALVVNPSQ